MVFFDASALCRKLYAQYTFAGCAWAQNRCLHSSACVWLSAWVLDVCLFVCFFPWRMGSWISLCVFEHLLAWFKFPHFPCHVCIWPRKLVNPVWPANHVGETQFASLTLWCQWWVAYPSVCVALLIDDWLVTASRNHAITMGVAFTQLVCVALLINDWFV
jgi:hypothetical protein